MKNEQVLDLANQFLTEDNEEGMPYDWARTGNADEVGYFQDRYQMLMMEKEEFARFVDSLQGAVYNMGVHRNDPIKMNDYYLKATRLIDELKKMTVPLKG